MIHDPEAPRLVGPAARVVDVDPRSAGDLARHDAVAREPEARALDDVLAVLGPVDAESAAELSGPGGGARVAALELAGAHQHRRREAGLPGHQVETVPHAVDEINVRASGLAEHDRAARR